MGAYVRTDAVGIRADVERVFGLFPRLKERRRQTAGTLSGGEQQMLAIGPRAHVEAPPPAPRRAVDGPGAADGAEGVRDGARGVEGGRHDPPDRAEREARARSERPRLRDGIGRHHAVRRRAGSCSTIPPCAPRTSASPPRSAAMSGREPGATPHLHPRVVSWRHAHRVVRGRDAALQARAARVRRSRDRDHRDGARAEGSPGGIGPRLRNRLAARRIRARLRRRGRRSARAAVAGPRLRGVPRRRQRDRRRHRRERGHDRGAGVRGLVDRRREPARRRRQRRSSCRRRPCWASTRSPSSCRCR